MPIRKIPGGTYLGPTTMDVLTDVHGFRPIRGTRRETPIVIRHPTATATSFMVEDFSAVGPQKRVETTLAELGITPLPDGYPRPAALGYYRRNNQWLSYTTAYPVDDQSFLWLEADPTNVSGASRIHLLRREGMKIVKVDTVEINGETGLNPIGSGAYLRHSPGQGLHIWSQPAGSFTEPMQHYRWDVTATGFANKQRLADLPLPDGVPAWTDFSATENKDPSLFYSTEGTSSTGYSLPILDSDRPHLKMGTQWYAIPDISDPRFNFPDAIPVTFDYSQAPGLTLPDHAVTIPNNMEAFIRESGGGKPVVLVRRFHYDESTHTFTPQAINLHEFMGLDPADSTKVIVGIGLWPYQGKPLAAFFVVDITAEGNRWKAHAYADIFGTPRLVETDEMLITAENEAEGNEWLYSKWGGGGVVGYERSTEAPLVLFTTNETAPPDADGYEAPLYEAAYTEYAPADPGRPAAHHGQYVHRFVAETLPPPPEPEPRIFKVVPEGPLINGSSYGNSFAGDPATLLGDGSDETYINHDIDYAAGYWSGPCSPMMWVPVPTFPDWVTPEMLALGRIRGRLTIQPSPTVTTNGYYLTFYRDAGAGQGPMTPYPDAPDDPTQNSMDHYIGDSSTPTLTPEQLSQPTEVEFTYTPTGTHTDLWSDGFWIVPYPYMEDASEGGGVRVHELWFEWAEDPSAAPAPAPMETVRIETGEPKVADPWYTAPAVVGGSTLPWRDGSDGTYVQVLGRHGTSSSQSTPVAAGFEASPVPWDDIDTLRLHVRWSSTAQYPEQPYRRVAVEFWDTADTSSSLLRFYSEGLSVYTDGVVTTPAGAPGEPFDEAGIFYDSVFDISASWMFATADDLAYNEPRWRDAFDAGRLEIRFYSMVRNNETSVNYDSEAHIAEVWLSADAPLPPPPDPVQEETSLLLRGPEGDMPHAEVHHGAFAIPPAQRNGDRTVSFRGEVAAPKVCWLQMYAQWYGWDPVSQTFTEHALDPVGPVIQFGTETDPRDKWTTIEIFRRVEDTEATHWRPKFVFYRADPRDVAPGEPAPVLAPGDEVYLDCLYVTDNGLSLTDHEQPYLDGDQPYGIWEGDTRRSPSIFGEKPSTQIVLGDALILSPSTTQEY